MEGGSPSRRSRAPARRVGLPARARAESFRTFATATEEPIAVIASARDAERVIAADVTGGIFRWDGISYERVGAWQQPSRIVALALSPDGARIALRSGAITVVNADGSSPLLENRRQISHNRHYFLASHKLNQIEPMGPYICHSPQRAAFFAKHTPIEIR